jgi:hypothetical protein
MGGDRWSRWPDRLLAAGLTVLPIITIVTFILVIWRFLH